MITAYFVMFAIQFLVSLGVTVFAYSEYTNDRSIASGTQGYRKANARQRMAVDQRILKFSLLGLVTSPVSMIVLPCFVLFFFLRLVKDVVKAAFESEPEVDR